jgi:hypothetical protein
MLSSSSLSTAIRLDLPDADDAVRRARPLFLDFLAFLTTFLDRSSYNWSQKKTSGHVLVSGVRILALARLAVDFRSAGLGFGAPRSFDILAR